MPILPDRQQKAANAVHRCLNYGGVFVDGSHTTRELSLAYQQGDIIDEVTHMRHFAAALLELASAIESEGGASRATPATSMTSKEYGIHVLQRMKQDVKKLRDNVQRENCEKVISAELRRQVKDFSDEDAS